MGIGSEFGAGRSIGGDDAFEMGAVFDHDFGGGDVAGDGGMLFDFNAFEGAQAALVRAVNDDFAGDGVGVYVGQFPDG